MYEDWEMKSREKRYLTIIDFKRTYFYSKKLTARKKLKKYGEVSGEGQQSSLMVHPVREE